MNYEECQEVLQQFQQTHPTIMVREDIHGIQIVKRDEEFIIELLVTKIVNNDQLLADEIAPPLFTCSVVGQTKSFSVLLREQVIPRVHVQQGDSVSYSSIGNPWGTAGWNVFFSTQNIRVCMSNYHVLVDPNNQRHGIDIFFRGEPEHKAQLHAFTLNETWDYALARYENNSDAEEIFRSCGDNSFPNATELSKDIFAGETYHKTGARTPICRKGKLLGVGDRTVSGYNGTTRFFRGQLIFEKMTDSGDSGAIIVREKDNTVTGLNFAGDDTETIANPIYKIGWSFVGTLKLASGGEIPVYDDTKSVVPTRPSLSAVSLSAVSFQSAQGADFAFAEGKFFLGVAVKQTKGSSGHAEDWIKPIPPAIRNVAVDVICYSSIQINQYGTTEDYYLCFG